MSVGNLIDDDRCCCFPLMPVIDITLVPRNCVYLLNLHTSVKVNTEIIIELVYKKGI